MKIGLAIDKTHWIFFLSPFILVVQLNEWRYLFCWLLRIFWILSFFASSFFSLFYAATIFHNTTEKKHGQILFDCIFFISKNFFFRYKLERKVTHHEYVCSMISCMCNIDHNMEQIKWENTLFWIKYSIHCLWNEKKPASSIVIIDVL